MFVVNNSYKLSILKLLYTSSMQEYTSWNVVSSVRDASKTPFKEFSWTLFCLIKLVVCFSFFDTSLTSSLTSSSTITSNNLSSSFTFSISFSTTIFSLLKQVLI